MVLIQLLLPTILPKGPAVHDATAALADTHRELAETFDGVTAYLRSPAKSIWTAPDGHTEQDDVVMVRSRHQALNGCGSRCISDNAGHRNQNRSMRRTTRPAARLLSAIETMAGRIYIGTAGWSIPRASAHLCPTEGTHLQRYARVFPCAEINSSFHRPHAASTYAKWAASTPGAFRFAVKVPRLITHELKLLRARAPFEQFLAESSGLGDQRGPLLVQLPPSFAFEPRIAARFFDVVRTHYDGPVVCEPRHPTWFAARPYAVMQRYAVARVAADPADHRWRKRSRRMGWHRLLSFARCPADVLVAVRRELPLAPRDACSADVRIGRRVVCLR